MLKVTALIARNPYNPEDAEALASQGVSRPAAMTTVASDSDPDPSSDDD